MASVLRLSVIFAVAALTAACSDDTDPNLFPGNTGGSGGGGNAGGSGGGGGGGCPPGFFDCDADPINGCEIDARADPINCGGCGAVCVDSACVDAACTGVTELAAQQGTPNAIAVDGQHLYWTTVIDEPSGAGEVRQMIKTGGLPLSVATDQPAPFAIAVDASRVYWTNTNQSTVLSAAIGSTMPEPFAEDLGGLFGIAVDGQALYWTRDEGDPANSGVVRAPLSGGDPTLIAAGGENPYAIVIDAQSVYWTDRDGGEVLKAPLAGGQPQVLANNQAEPYSIALDADHVYWTNFGCLEMDDCVMRIRKDGSGGVEPLAGAQSVPYGIATDGVHVYWSDTGFSTIMRIPTGGGTPEELAVDPGSPGRIALDDAFVYWINEAGGVRKIKK